MYCWYHCCKMYVRRGCSWIEGFALHGRCGSPKTYSDALSSKLHVTTLGDGVRHVRDVRRRLQPGVKWRMDTPDVLLESLDVH